MRLFKSKKQIAELKELPLLSATKNLHQRLRLSRLEIVFSITQRQPLQKAPNKTGGFFFYNSYGIIQLTLKSFQAI